MKFTLSIKDGQTQSSISAMKVGVIDVPASDLAKVQSGFTTLVQKVVERTPTNIDVLTFGDGTVHIVGSLPNIISLSPPVIT
jgi:hypothetical protein